VLHTKQTDLGLPVELAAAEEVVDRLRLALHVSVGILVKEEVQRLLLACHPLLSLYDTCVRLVPKERGSVLVFLVLQIHGRLIRYVHNLCIFMI
jgi:hypothetical protein